MELITLSVALFLILSPFGFVPMILKLLQPYSPKRQCWILARELVIALIILLLFAFFGSQILGILGIKQAAVQIGGGIIIFLIGLSLIIPHHLSLGMVEIGHEPFVFPIATPIIAGGGMIAAVMVYSVHITERWVFFTAILIAWAATGLVYFAAPYLKRILSDQVLGGIEKLMGLILVLMSVQMFLSGIVLFTQTELREDGTQNVLGDIHSKDATESVKSSP